MSRLPPLPGSFRRFFGNRSGAVAPLIALMLPVLLGLLALGSEAGSWFLKQRELQHFADVAAYSAAVQLSYGADAEEARKVALAVLSASGFESADAPEIDIPPTTGPHEGMAGYAEVRLRTTLLRYFSGLFNTDGLVPLSGRAVARGGESQGRSVCMLSLSPQAPRAITISGSARVTLVGCSFALNSTASDSFFMEGGGSLSVTAGCISTAGDVVTTIGLTLTDCVAPETRRAAVIDPFKDLADPAPIPACETISARSTFDAGTGWMTVSANPAAAFTRFCGGITINSTEKYNFRSGIYIVDGGSFTVNAGAILSGTGVSFFLTNNARLKFNGTSVIRLTAPATGPYAGLLFFSSKTATPVVHQFSGTSASEIDGSLYLPKAVVEYRGDFGDTRSCVQVVSEQLRVVGNSTLNMSCTPVGGRAIYTIGPTRLVE